MQKPHLSFTRLMLFCVPWSLLHPARESFAGELTNREVARGFALEEWRVNDHDAAIATLREHLGEDPEDAEAKILVGQILMDQKKVREAAVALREVAVALPVEERGIALYHLADAFARMGQLKEARGTLAQAKRDPRLKESVAKASQKVIAGKALPPLELKSDVLAQSPQSEDSSSDALGWSGSVGFQSGYDSNVILSSESTLASADATQAASPSAALGGTIRYRGKSILVDQALSVSAYSSEAAQAFNAVQFTGVQKWLKPVSDRSKEESGFGIQNELSVLALNLDGFGYYMSSDTVRSEWAWLHKSGSKTQVSAPLGYQHISLSESAGEANNRSGFLGGLDVEHSRSLFSGQWRSGLSIARLFAEGSNYVSNTGSVRTSWMRPNLFLATHLLLSFDLSGIDYVTSDSDRRDLNWGTTLGLSRSWGKSLRSQFQVSYRKNESTVEDGVYQKLTTGLGVTYGF